MLKSNTPNFQASGAVADSLEFVKNLWGSMGIPGAAIPAGAMPGMVLPTLSVEELKKKITDLRAVESWLELNMNMLRATIQALEVQAATMSALQSMGEAMAATVQAGAAAAAQAATGETTKHEAAHAPEPTEKDQSDATAFTAPLVNAAAWWNLLQDQFQHAVANAMTEAAKEAPAEPPTPEASDPPSAEAQGTRKRKAPPK